MEHCPEAYAISLCDKNIENDDFFKICYSGDTRPCKSIIDNTKNYDVLIHECTFNDDMMSNAI